MRAGTLNRRIEIWQEGWEIHPIAGQQKVTTLLDTVWASRQDQGGQDFMAVGVELNRALAVFRIRFRSDLSTDVQIKDGEQTFDVQAINEIGRREGLELLCKAVS